MLTMIMSTIMIRFRAYPLSFSYPDPCRCSPAGCLKSAKNATTTNRLSLPSSAGASTSDWRLPIPQVRTMARCERCCAVIWFELGGRCQECRNWHAGAGAGLAKCSRTRSIGVTLTSASGSRASPIWIPPMRFFGSCCCLVAQCSTVCRRKSPSAARRCFH